MPKVIGITGGIAAGKSTVLRIFAELGAEVLSADDLAREVLVKGAAGYADVVAYFGEDILSEDGEIDRQALATIIFSDSEARQALNNITHPRIITAMQDHINRFRTDSISERAVMAVEIPLLIECGLENIVDEVLVVAAEPQAQVSRLITRNGISADEADRRIASQMPIDQKIDHADRIIYNDGSLNDLKRSVRVIWDEIHLL